MNREDIYFFLYQTHVKGFQNRSGKITMFEKCQEKS